MLLFPKKYVQLELILFSTSSITARNWKLNDCGSGDLLCKDGNFIYIRYFPAYDGQEKYRGVIEVSQEVSGIRRLEGEQRILDWI